MNEGVKEMSEKNLPIPRKLVRSLRERVSLKPAEASFRQGWKEARTGETRPVSELWEVSPIKSDKHFA